MRSVFEIVKESGEWEIFEREVRRNYNSKDIIKNHIGNMEKFFKEIEVPEGWKAKFDDPHEIDNEDVFFDIIVFNENNERTFYFTFKLEAVEHSSFFTLLQLMLYVDEYDTIIEDITLENTDFSKLLARYNELKKIFREVKKTKREVK